MKLGTVDRAANSAETSRTCCSLGTLPVNRSQKRPNWRQIKTRRRLMVRQTFRERLVSSWRLWQQLLALWYCLSSEPDALL